VAEIRSRTDNLAPLQRKMDLWMAGGVRLGWLIDPENRRVYVYRQAQPEPETLEDPETLDGGDVLVGFSFPVRQYVFDLQ
jgi:Uma2 family endonuclease